MPSRRAALLLPLLAAACAQREEPLGPAPRPLGFTHLLPLQLNVAALEIEETDPPVPPGDLGASLATPPAAAVRLMAHDRIRTVGTTGQASFRVTQASLLRSGGGLLCQVGCRLDIRGAEGGRVGFVEAQARASQTLPDGASAALVTRTGETLLRRAMDDLNVEFEFRLKQSLRAWLVEALPGSGGLLPAPTSPGVVREDLPRP